MLRIFTYTNPLVYVLLLVFVFAIRSSTFQTEYSAPSETRNWVLAQRMADGASLYTDAWDSRPPAAALVYRAALALAGPYAVLLLRMLACLYVALCCMALHLILIEYRIEYRLALFPPFLLALLLCSPWYALEVNEEFLALLPMLLSIRLLIRHYVDGDENNAQLFSVGFWCAFCILLKYQGLVLLLTAVFTVVFMSRRPLKDLVTLMSGTLALLLCLLLWLYLNSALDEFWDQTVLYPLDRVRIAEPFPVESPALAFGEQLAIYGIISLLGLRAWVALRSRPASATVRERKIETMFSIWLFGTVATLFIAATQTRLVHYWLVFPVLTFFLSVHYRSASRRFWPKLPYILSLILLLVGSLSYLPLLDASNFNTLRSETGLTEFWKKLEGRIHPTTEQQLAREYLQKHPALNGVWVIAPDPLFHHRIREKAGTRYTNLPMTVIKMDWLSINHRQPKLLSRSEPLDQLYETFLREQPDVIFDPNGVFAELRESMPLLLNHYQADGNEALRVFRRSARRADQINFPL